MRYVALFIGFSCVAVGAHLASYHWLVILILLYFVGTFVLGIWRPEHYANLDHNDYVEAGYRFAFPYGLRKTHPKVVYFGCWILLLLFAVILTMLWVYHDELATVFPRRWK